MNWPLSHLLPLSLLLRGRSSGPKVSVLMPRPDHRDAADIDRQLARAQARATRDATLLQALKMNGGSFWP